MVGLRIVHVVSSLHSGGMEHFVVRLAAAQRRDGHAASLVVLRAGGVLEPLARRLGLPLTVLAGPKPVRVGLTAVACARRRPHVLHAHNPTSLHYATAGKLVTCARLVLTDHAAAPGGRVPTRFEWRRTDVVVGCSRHTTARGEQVGVARTTIHNGVDLDLPVRARAETRAALGCPEGQLVGVIPARLDPVKGHDVLLAALARLRGRGIDVAILVAGDGPERGRLQALARALGLADDRARFLGFRPDVRDLLAAADFLVLPSRGEGLPLAVLEAMAEGLPVVVTPVGGVPELVDHEIHGLVVPVDDPAALADALARLAGDPALRRRLGAAGQARVRASFSFPAMVRAYERLYLDLMASRSP